MLLLRRSASARAGLIGNPSDGYHGRTISFSVWNFYAEVVLYEWDQVEVILSQDDRSRFRNVHELARDVELHGYYGGVRLVKATIKKFVEYCDERGLELHDGNFSVRYSSNIPRQVGLAGSSAIIVATLRCLMDFYGIEIDERAQPSLVLSVEAEELGIGAGLQDRVIQVYEGLVDMDFSQAQMETVDRFSCGSYERIDPALLPPMYIAYRHELSQPTEVLHNDLRARYERGEPQVCDAMQQFRELAAAAREALDRQDRAAFDRALDANFDLRQSICQLPSGQVEMVERARSVGATAKFSGSGGAIVGTFDGAPIYAQLAQVLGDLGCTVIVPALCRDQRP